MTVKVHVVTVKGKPLALRWIDPVTQTTRQKSAGTRNRHEAERKAAELAKVISHATPLEHMTWKELRTRFEAERMTTLSEGTRECYGITFNLFEKLTGSIRLRDVSVSVLSRFQAELRKAGRKEITVLKHVRQLRAALQWAYDLELIDRVPNVPKPPRGSIQKKMKGRPLSQAEFERFLDAIPKVVGDEHADAWRFFARSLWYQGLRVNEALHLSWDREDWHRVDLDQEHPVIWIRGQLEKGKKDRVHPMAPEFAALLAEVPEHERFGPVFSLPEVDRTKPKWQRAWVSGVGMRIGRQAGLLVSKDAQTGKEKCASFHDLRRSCALRWAAHLMPQELMEFMRHSSMQVTLDYYVGQRAMQTAERMWSIKARHPDSGIAVISDREKQNRLNSGNDCAKL